MTDEPQGTLHQLFAARAAATPTAVAVTCGDSSLTWADLQANADALAARLRQAGLGSGAAVALLLDGSPDLLAAPLAVLAAGGACAMLDPAQPPGRLAQLLAGARPHAILAQRALARRLPPQRVPLLFVDDAPAAAAAPPAAAPETPSAQTAPATSPAAAAVSANGAAWVYSLPQAATLTHRQLVERFAATASTTAAAGTTATAATSAAAATAEAPADLPGIAPLWALFRDGHVTVTPPRSAAAMAPRPAGAAPIADTAAGATAADTPGDARGLDLSLFYFGNYSAGQTADHYRLVLEGARFADRHGFRAVWTPERHFHEFGGLYPNPSVMSAAIAAITERVQIRAGSVVLPLHNPLRVAEEWALVDNLSKGRVGLSVASGWHANDFVLDPAAYAGRHEAMKRGIDTVRRLWRGESLRLPSGTGTEVDVRIYPRPVQAELPIWITAAGSPDTFRLAGEVGAGVLTHMLGQEAAEIAAKIHAYRDAYRQAGHSGPGHVTVMLHTYVGPDLPSVHRVVREPLGNYLKTSFGLLRSLAKSVGLDHDPNDLAAAELDLLVSRAYDRYVAEGSGLIGTPETCANTLARLRALGVDEVACLIDFGAPTDAVLAGLTHLDDLRRATVTRPPAPQLAPA